MNSAQLAVARCRKSTTLERFLHGIGLKLPQSAQDSGESPISRYRAKNRQSILKVPGNHHFLERAATQHEALSFETLLSLRIVRFVTRCAENDRRRITGG
jgi:hypothetical protein